MENVETLFFDESGTPADPNDGLFVIGGFALRGEIKPLQNNYEEFLYERNLCNKKGRRYSEEDYIHLSDFMCRNNIMPITSFSYLDKNDLYYLKKKIDEFKKLKNDLKKEKAHTIKPEVEKIAMSKDRYIWMLQAAITIASSALGLAINRGKIEKMDISIDKYLAYSHNQNIINTVIQNFFNPLNFAALFGDLFNKHWNHPETQLLLENLPLPLNFISLDLNARGKFKLLSDSVCAMYRKKLQGNYDAKGAWEVLSLHFKKGKQVHMCLGNNVTKYLKEIVRTPWSTSRT